jgi:hypothetical protein
MSGISELEAGVGMCVCVQIEEVDLTCRMSPSYPSQCMSLQIRTPDTDFGRRACPQTRSKWTKCNIYCRLMVVVGAKERIRLAHDYRTFSLI